MTHGIERLTELMQADPPADLDALVQQRMRAALRPPLQTSVDRDETTMAQGERRSPGAVPLPLAERWVYAAGLVAYGAQALMGAARLFWRAVAG